MNKGLSVYYFLQDVHHSSTLHSLLYLQGSVYSIAVNGDEIYTGGQDCKIKKVNADDLSDIDTWQLDEDTHARVRAIAFVGDNIAVGTYNNGMLFGKFGDDIEQIIYVSLMIFY